MVKNPPTNPGNTGGAGSIPGSGRSPGVGNATRSNILNWKTLRSEEAGRLQSMGSQGIRYDERLSTHTHTEDGKPHGVAIYESRS